jgi:hypothetical protein
MPSPLQKTGSRGRQHHYLQDGNDHQNIFLTFDEFKNDPDVTDNGNTRQQAMGI